MEIKIREWNQHDLLQIQQAWLDFCRIAARSDMKLRPQAEPEMTQWLAARYRHAASFGLIAERDDSMAGFLVGRVDEWESAPPIIEPRRLGIIDGLYVSEECRRNGIASRLIEHAMQLLRQRKVVAVETIYDAWSDGASATWNHAGFAPWMVHAFRLL